VLRATHLYLQGPLRTSGGGGAGSASGSDEDDDAFQMVAGGSSGSVEVLPPHTRAVVAALGHVQSHLDAAAAEHRAARLEAAKAAAAQVEALYTQRRTLLLEAGAPAAPRCYWLRLLRSIDTAALAITPRDAAVLQHLVDVRFELLPAASSSSNRSSKGASSSSSSLEQRMLHYTWELEFSEGCPQLAADCKTLHKEYTYTVKSGSVGPSSLRLQSSKVVAPPKWAAGVRDPTHRRARDGRNRPCASFFHLFRLGGGGGKLAFNLTGVEKEVQVRSVLCCAVWVAAGWSKVCAVLMCTLLRATYNPTPSPPHPPILLPATQPG